MRDAAMAAAVLVLCLAAGMASGQRRENAPAPRAAAPRYAAPQARQQARQQYRQQLRQQYGQGQYRQTPQQSRGAVGRRLNIKIRDGDGLRGTPGESCAAGVCGKWRAAAGVCGAWSGATGTS